MNKISYEIYRSFRIDYFVKGKYPHLRFGQAFLNTYFPNLSDPILYYANDIEYCNNVITINYVEEENEN